MKKQTLVISNMTEKVNFRDKNSKPQLYQQNYQNIQTHPKKSCFTKKSIFIPLGISILIFVGIITTIILVSNRKSKNKKLKKHDSETPIIDTLPYNEKEYEFKTKVGDLYRINVDQKYMEEITTFGQKNFQFVERKTNYDIYFISETNSTEETKYFFKKTFLGAILISSHCIDTQNDNCEPEPFIGLTEIKKGNLRFLDEIPDLKDIPLPLCLFNITNNDIITSITCPESLHKSIRRNMILDLNFFRPPAIKRPDNETNNVKITKSKINGNEFISENNEGKCNIPGTFDSFCNTKTNKTFDSRGNIIIYEEKAFTNITHDINNSYIKDKITKLKDESEKITHVDKDIYKKVLEALIKKLNPYFKYYEQFSTDNFKELCNITKNISNENEQRRLQQKEKEESFYFEQNLFNYTHYTDTQLFINLRNEPGYNSESMKATVNLLINEGEKEIVGLKEIINFDFIKKSFKDLSRIGNEMAFNLYNKIKLDFEHINEVVNNNISCLLDLIMNEETKSLSAIFDSVSNLEKLKIFPKSLVEESTNLKQKLNSSLNMIENGGMKSKIKPLNEEINDFITKSHKLVDNVFKNTKILSKLLKSSKSKLAEISTYYLNNTSNSFSNIIEESKNLLSDYYSKEENLIFSKVDLLVNNFTKGLNESIKQEQLKINILLEKLEKGNINIENGNDEDKNILIFNLKESKDIINKIIIKVEQLIKSQMNLKENGHFISDYDILSTKNSYFQDIEEALESSKSSENFENIDKIFYRTYSDFRDNYTKLMLHHRKIIEEKIPFLDNVLDNSLFKEKEKIDLESNLSYSSLKIINRIRDENNDYLKLASEEISDFLKKNNETLNELMINFTKIFSQYALHNLEELYEQGLNSSFIWLDGNIKNNKNLSNYYFSKLAQFFENDKAIIEFLKNVKVDIPSYVKENSARFSIKNEESITKKSKTQAYLNKYKKFKETIKSSKEYINDLMTIELRFEYKMVINKLKDLLQMIKNVKLNGKLNNFKDLKFIRDNIDQIDVLYETINNYFSEQIFDEKFIPVINNHKQNFLKEINEIDINIVEANHLIINKYDKVDDYNNDFCFGFLRKMTYTCISGVVTKAQKSLTYSENLKDYSDNYKLLSSLSIYSDENIQKFKGFFDSFYSELNKIVISYTNLINELSNKLHNLEEQAIMKSSTAELYQEYKNVVNDILSKKYGEKIILQTYNFFQKDIEERANIIFNELVIGWKELFSNFYKEINKNMYNYKNSINEFGLIANIYYAYLSTNISENYYNLIMANAKNEFNNTLIYYYSYLIRLIKSEKQKIINKIPINYIGFERVLEQRINEVNELFDDLLEDILNSQYNGLSPYNHLYLQQVSDTNFFNISYNLTYLRKKIKNNCEKIKDNIYGLDNSKENDINSYISRYYLEISENGKQIDEFFKETDNSNFVYLETEKFKELLTKNWIFDQGNFIKSLNNAFKENNAEIAEELSTEIEEYENILENELIKYSLFDKDNIIEKINFCHKNAILELKEEIITQTNEDISEIVEKIIFHLSEEKIRLADTILTYYQDYSLINKTIENYKVKILDNFNIKIFYFINDFRNYLDKELYSNYYLKHSNILLNEIKTETESYEEIKLLNLSYNIDTIIEQITKNLLKKYGYIYKDQIVYKGEEYIEKFQLLLNFQQIQNYINEQIDLAYLDFYENLQKRATVDNKIIGYFKYDLSDEIKEDLDNLIKTKYDIFEDTINSLKGEKYNNIDINNKTEWEIPDFSRILNVVKTIKDLFYSFIISQKNNEEDKINNFIDQLIRSNFNDLLNNLIPSFGSQFFKRIIAYNENFKLNNLFNNLGWAFQQSISYIENFGVFNKIDQITKDLKIKIYKMNDLDSKINENNKKILNLLNTKENDFILDLKNYVLQRYKYYIINDVNVEMAFDENIQKVIKNIFQKSLNETEKDYDKFIKKYLKENLISAYTKILDKNTEIILRKITSQRDYLTIILDDIYSIDSNDVLNEINNQINLTNNSLTEYKYHFNQFKISEEIFEYLNNYGKTEINPLYQNLENSLNIIYKDVIILNLDKNSEDYENTYNFKYFIKIINQTYDEIKYNYINNIYESSFSYYDNYPLKLEQNMNILNLRRLNDFYDIFDRKFADISLEEIFHKLLNNSQQIKNFIESLQLFDEFDHKISNSINDLNSAYKKAKKLILDNNYEEKTRINLEKRLIDLKNFTMEYYSLINDSFYNLKYYLNSSISEINDLLNNCANITYETFEKKYSEYFEKVNPINIHKKENDAFNYIKEILTQNYEITVFTSSENIKKEAIFKYFYEYDIENGIKIPRLKTILNNLSNLKKLKFKIEKEITFCAKEIEEIEIAFNNVNYSVLLDFSPNSKNILSTISTIFDDFEYTIERYNTSDISEHICVGDGINTLRICFRPKCSNTRDKTLVSKRKFIVDKKIIKEIRTIPE